MNQFSISQLSQFSGIKAHTIRIWEQRYKALQPHRSEGNTRYYDGKQLRRLLNIVSLTEAGYKISQLGAMQDEQLFSLIAKLEEKERGSELNEVYISQLIAAAMDFNEVHFEKTFSHCLLKYGIREAYLLVIYPLLKRVGLLWASNTIPPAREHFISNIIRQKLYTAIDALPPEGNKYESWLLFLPENEFHEIGLLFANYMIRSSGRKVTYMGANLPFQSLADAVEQVSPSKLLMFLVHYDQPEIIQQYIKDLELLLPDQEIYLSGNMKLLGQLDLGKRTHKIGSVAELEKELEFMVDNEAIY
jgi:DNA-binding transcriptional MerR regulator